MVVRLIHAILFIFLVPVSATTLNQASVEFTDGNYRMAFDVEVNAPRSEVYRLLTDYEHLPRLNDMVRESHILPSSDPGDRTRETILQFCLMFFCNSVTIVERLLENGTDTITASVIPEQSDLKYGETEMFIRAVNEKQARIQYASSIEPAFWIPPVIGPWLVRKKMEAELGVMIQRIESLVNEKAQ